MVFQRIRVDGRQNPVSPSRYTCDERYLFPLMYIKVMRTIAISSFVMNLSVSLKDVIKIGDELKDENPVNWDKQLR